MSRMFRPAPLLVLQLFCLFTGGMLFAAEAPRLQLLPIYKLQGEGEHKWLYSKEPTNNPALFRAVVTNQWFEGLVPIFLVESEGGNELRRQPPKGQENSLDPIFFCVPPESETDAGFLAGRWECEAIRETETKLWPAWEIAPLRETFAARFDQNTDYRSASIIEGTWKNKVLKMKIDYAMDQFFLSARPTKTGFAGEWWREDGTEKGTLKAWRMDQAPQIPEADQLEDFFEWRKGAERDYGNRQLRQGLEWIRSEEPLGRVWRTETRSTTLHSYLGKTPQIDGIIGEGEWTDATSFSGVQDWTPEFSAVRSDSDLALKGYVKHDRDWLYFAFEITDDVLYGIDTPRWLPSENAKAHELSRDGFPWFGDEMELLVNASGKWTGEEESDGSGLSWQMVCNLTKSRLGGVGVGGLLEGEPRSKKSAWETYQRWILLGDQRAATTRKQHGYVIEWAVKFKPCLEIKPGEFYSVHTGEVSMGLNIALGDLDLKETGAGNFGNFHHEQWLSGNPHTRTRKKEWGRLIMHGAPRQAP